MCCFFRLNRVAVAKRSTFSVFKPDQIPLFVDCVLLFAFCNSIHAFKWTTTVKRSEEDNKHRMRCYMFIKCTNEWMVKSDEGTHRHLRTPRSGINCSFSYKIKFYLCLLNIYFSVRAAMCQMVIKRSERDEERNEEEKKPPPVVCDNETRKENASSRNFSHYEFAIISQSRINMFSVIFWWYFRWNFFVFSCFAHPPSDIRSLSVSMPLFLFHAHTPIIFLLTFTFHSIYLLHLCAVS